MIELSAEQLKLLEQLMADEGIDLSAAKPIRLQSDRTDLKLSFAQQSLWLLDQLDPGNPAYNIPSALQLIGQLNVPVLGSALSEIERRHEALRTTFSSVDGQPRQVIHPTEFLQLPLIDLRELAPAERQAEATRLIAEEALRSFDLSRGPLFRASLLRLEERKHVLVLTMHHIISDGWSSSVFWRELSQLYPAFLDGQASPLGELAIQYADYAAWQREQLTDEVLAEQFNYWRDQLAGAPALLELPTARARPAVRSNRGAVVALRMNEGETDLLRQLSRSEGVTMFMTLAAAFALQLWRYSGQEEIIMGTPASGRNRREVEGLIGFFVNTLVLRIDLQGDPTFRQLLRRVREVCLSAYAHQDVSFEKLIEELRPKRDQSHTPIFQVYLNMLNFEQAEMKLPGIEVRSVATPLLSKFDLTLYVVEDRTGIDFTMVYNTDLFERPSVVEMIEQLRHLCSQIVREPTRKIALFSLLTPRTAALLPDPTQPLGSRWEGAVQDLFSQRAKSRPDHLAVKDARESWTYGELEARSNQLANYLLANNIKRQDIVAIYGHRSASVAWAVLGILKAGAAFCILDPTHPDSRSIDYLSLAKPLGWLQIEAAGELSPALDEVVMSLSSRCRLRLSADSALAGPNVLMNYSVDNPQVEVSRDDLACLTFTSGSTGRPKGVLGRHQSLSHFAAWATETFDFNESDRFSMLSGLSHDPLQRDIFTPLQLGATLCIPDQEGIGTPTWLAQWMAQEGITVTNLTPAMIQLLTQTVSDPKACEVSRLRYAFVVGDVLTRNDVARLRELAPSVTCINLYGTTETQRALGYYIVSDQTLKPQDKAARVSSEKESLPVGQGIDEVQLLVLTAGQQLAGVGELGELYVRSPHLARGYLHDSLLTRARFIINPFTKVTTDRLYRSGDLGRYLPDGNVELFGRSDHQVQIRGFRVEPSEVETALKEHEGVRECLVMAREHANGDKQLAAYVVPTTEVAPTIRDLTRSLRQKLPTYMIPSTFVMMKNLPLTPNGKVDRQALPAPDQSQSEVEAGYVGPSTPIEEMIAGILAELLQVEVGVHDDFFGLGGHSLLAMQLVARVRAALRVAVPLRDLFATPTVAGLAASIERQLLSSSAAEAPPIIHLLQDPEPQLSISQEAWLLREWWEDVHLLAKRPFHIVSAFRLTGALNLNLLEQALNEVVRRHDALRTTFPKTKGILSWKGFFPVFRRVLALKGLHNTLHKLNYKGASKQKQPIFVGGRKLVIGPLGTLPLRVVDLHGMSEAEKMAEMSRVINGEIRTPFEYNGSPMLRVVVIKLAAQEHVVNVVMHHLIADGMSKQIFLRDLLTLYSSLAEGRPSTLPELPIQYSDFARWQRQWFQGENLESMFTYWKEQFTGDGLFPELPLPFTNPDPPSCDFQNMEVQVSTVGSTLYESLKRLSHQQGVTLYMMCIGALTALLHRYTGRQKISIFAPFANRTRTETHDLIGWFANNHVLTTDCSGDLPFSELLERVRGVVLGAYAHQEVPYWLIVKMLMSKGGDYEMPQRLVDVPYVFFDFHAHTQSRQQLANLTVSSVSTPPTSGDAGVEVRVLEHADSLDIMIKYSPDRTAPMHIGRMRADFQALLQGVVANPDARLRDLPLGTAGEEESRGECAQEHSSALMETGES